jgi:hypothetical protein
LKQGGGSRFFAGLPYGTTDRVFKSLDRFGSRNVITGPGNATAQNPPGRITHYAFGAGLPTIDAQK